VIVAAVLFLFSIQLFSCAICQKDESRVQPRRKETADILRTVNEGLFLLDRNMKIGTEKSMALAGIFRP